ncbi:nucleotidyltransferase domain-containing protein [Curtobacterium sp. L3-7]|uniref:nucleotidyltransferase domain-containing protein n=1 Tax=Curtobacterium sp. L3-7 TaxID=3138787 RepID=UPI003B520AAB
MATWQAELFERLRAALPDGSVRAYGSLVDGDLDEWSDLDVEVSTSEHIDIERLLDTRLWAWQQSVAEDGQVLRLVTRDGRRLDLTITGPAVVLPEPPIDNAVRFDAALAATRLGRGNLLIGLHLVLGIGREALVESMRAADLAAGTVHHRVATPFDARAAEVAALTSDRLEPETALRAYELYGARRSERDSGYAPDPAGLVALIDLSGGG